MTILESDELDQLYLTESDYLATEPDRALRHEYFDGQIRHGVCQRQP